MHCIGRCVVGCWRLRLPCRSLCLSSLLGAITVFYCCVSLSRCLINANVSRYRYNVLFFFSLHTTLPMWMSIDAVVFLSGRPRLRTTIPYIIYNIICNCSLSSFVRFFLSKLKICLNSIAVYTARCTTFFSSSPVCYFLSCMFNFSHSFLSNSKIHIAFAKIRRTYPCVSVCVCVCVCI